MSDTSKFPELSERAQHLLKVLVERYINGGQPVGSRALSREAGLSLSPATIRNIMADLEDCGLITSPHTSAGRLPTVSGYRFFIDSLLTVKPLGQETVRQFQRNLGNIDDPEDLLETASRMLSDMTHMAGLVTMPRREAIIFRMIEFLPLSEQRVLVILVTNAQEVQNRIIHPARRFSAAELTAVANYLNSVYAGKDLASIRESLLQELSSTRDQMDRELIHAAEIADLALQCDRKRRKKPFMLTGETNLMDFDELASKERLRILFSAFRQKEDMVHLLDRCLETSGVKIFIGEESGYQALDQCSLVTASYSIEDQAVGVLGVIGPTRMEYEHVIPLVDLTAKLLGAALNQKSLSPS
ncbi:MAG: heat-inducible transcriptional repressor HrcA [Methylococcaceae bacterium]|nr:heat-inducible transcriptional repressor HrcA [Methylococcaceae bacterium]